MASVPEAWMRLAIVNCLELLRDRFAIGFIILFPLVFLLIFGYSQENYVLPKLDVAFVNDAGWGGDAFGRSLRESKSLSVSVVDYSTARKSVRDSKVAALVRITKDNGYSITSIATPSSLPFVKLYVEASALALEQSLRARQNVSFSFRPFGSQPRSQFSYVFPGLVALTLLQLCITGTALPLLRAREAGVLVYLSFMPFSRLAIVFAQIVPRLCLAIIAVAIMLVAASTLFHAMYDTSSTIALLALSATAMVAVGYLVASCSSFSVGSGVASMLNLLMIFGSGLFTSNQGLVALRMASLFLPLTPIADGLRQVMNGSPGVLPLWVDVMMILGWIVIGIVGSAYLFKFEPSSR